MIVNQKRIKDILFIALLFFIAWMCRFPLIQISTIPYLGAIFGLLRPLIYIGFCAAWSVSLSRSIINKRLRIYLKLIAFSCILWLFMRTVKWELTFRGDIVNILLQYAFYIPFIMIPTLGFFVSMYARRGERYSMPRWIHVTVGQISTIALLFVFTNPLHELFWKHDPEPYSHAIGYFCVVAWISLLVLMAVVNIIVRARIPGRRTPAVLPMIVLGIIIVYYAMIFLFPKMWRFLSADWTSFTCIATIALLQACIMAGMLPSNTGYAKIFEASAKEIVITDDDWNVCFVSAETKLLSREIMEQTEAGVVQLDKDTLLKGRKLHPGHVVWREDISDMAAILDELEQNKRELSAKIELDRENTRTERALFKLQEKNRLYDASQQATSKQNKRLTENLSQYFSEEDASVRKALLAEAAVLGAYIKRKGNLIFAGDKGSIKASELRLCLNESLNNASLTQADCQMEYALSDDTELSLKNALLLYDSFETAIEAVLSDLQAVFIRVTEDEKNLRGLYSLVSTADLSVVPFSEEVSIERDDDTWIVSLSLSKGGADE